MEEEFETGRGLPKPLLIILVIVGALFCIWLGVVLSSFEGRDAQAEALREQEEEMIRETEPGPGDDHGTLRIASDISAKPAPGMIRLSEVPESLMDKQVVGISVGSTHHAYIIDRVSGQKNLMLFTTSIEATPIVTLHNYRQNKTFVWTSNATDMVDVAFGGYDNINNIILKFSTVRFVQDSERMPLKPYPFEVMTLKQWSELHPTTLVNIDESKSNQDYFANP